MSNYYEPKIEEFHVGFECEFKNKMQSNEWEKQVCDWDLLSIALDVNEHDESLAEEFRVKYLDQEDIESLGWKFIGKSIDDWYELKGEFDMATWTSYHIKMHFHSRDTKYQRGRMFIDVVDCGEDNPIFQGVIKNKSEFRKLMIQLGLLKT